ncbi:MAG TPA: hypothetical protein DDY98_09300 [Ruminococcaceae bacterium]|nr:hypothetical protein [Oscillospiraceae bacterium]
MYYSIGPLTLQSNIELPNNYEVFQDAAQGNADCDICLVASDCKPNLNLASKRATHSLMIVWETADGWIFESTKHDGFLTVSRDYTDASFYCETDDKQECLRPLLQAVVECRMIRTGTTILHSACVVKDGKAIAFSAASGTGKSKRASRWVKLLGATWLSGDRPAIHLASKKAFGVPWDGKEQIFVNASAPIQAIVEIKRSGKTYTRRMTNRQKVHFLSNQLFIPMWDTQLTQIVFIGIKHMTEQYPIYRLYCDISEESTKEAYDILFNGLENSLEEKDEKTFKLKNGFELREIAGEYSAVAVGDNLAAFGGSVVLNEVSAFLLKNMKTAVTEEELLGLLTNEYDIDEASASADLTEILTTFRKIGLVE